MQDCNCEEENSESEKSNDKDEKKDITEYFSFNNNFGLSLSLQVIFHQQSKLSFATSDYSRVVYSPPEFIAI